MKTLTKDRSVFVFIFISEYGILLMPTTTHLAMNIQTQVCTINTHYLNLHIWLLVYEPKHISLLAYLLGSTVVSSYQSGDQAWFCISMCVKPN